MKVVKVFVNLASEDESESLFIFDDEYVVAGSEKQTIVVNPTGQKVGSSYKACCEEPHALAVQEYIEQNGYGDPEDFTPEMIQRWCKIMGPNSVMMREHDGLRPDSFHSLND